ncbi:GTPase Era [uncultured Paludibaculum sp.]|uniref:GTPase Era n=1 Tax=uncultured Paludibaculum sp. TaxID=1765020 RepID=UPI002AAC0F53|nr:GTPase Era [uncultured Paludibaculum sp.]
MSKNRSKSKPKHRSGFVSILGRPNAGKSTLLNALLGTKLSIVADKPQTTRTTVQGVLTLPEAQIVFVDTPGIHDADTVFNRRMMQSISEALEERDLLLYLIDSTRHPGAEDEKSLELIKDTATKVFAVFNKIDLIEKKNDLLPVIEQYSKWREFTEYFPISAETGEGLEALKKAILEQMPSGPAYYPEDYITDQPERFMAAEIVREKILLTTRQEVPHSVAVVVDEWKEEGRLTRISATIHVERPGQKAIILGARGALMKEIGTEARLEIEKLLERKVFLSLFVKVSPKWRENETFLKELDWRAMIGGEAAGAPESEDNVGE